MLTKDVGAFLLPVLEILWINVILSGDNAIVIALACSSLPKAQRSRAIIAGTAAAIALRIIFTIFFVKVLSLPYVKLVGGLLLLWIAIRLARNERNETPDSSATSIWGAMRAIVVADAFMSLDNVVAIAAAAKGSVLLVVFGLALSVPIIVFGSSLLTGLLSRFPFLTWASAALLGFIGGEMIAAEKRLQTFSFTHSAYWEIGCGILGAALVVSLAMALQFVSKHDKV